MINNPPKPGNSSPQKDSKSPSILEMLGQFSTEFSKGMAKLERSKNAERLQTMLLARATGGNYDPDEYKRLRKAVMESPHLAAHVPYIVSEHRDLDQVWQFISNKFRSYKERRTYIWSECSPLLTAAEREGAPGDASVGSSLSDFSPNLTEQYWAKALARRNSDPEGAITSARTLLEAVCKHILDELAVEYDDKADLPKLYKLVADKMQLSPGGHTETVFKQILGGCQAVVEGLGALRNKVSDAHGSGKKAVRPSPRHANLAVNLAGSMSAFLVETLASKKRGPTK